MRVVQCWDDGVTDDVRLAELLRARGVPATFNLNMGTHKAARHGNWSYKGKPVFKLALGELREVYAGFDIANHSLTHANLTGIAPEAALADIRDGRDAVEQHFGRPVAGFVYPCGNCDEAVAKIVRDTGHLYARTTQNVNHVFPPADPMFLHSSCHFKAEDFQRRYELAKAEDGVFYFWGHSYELMDESDWAELERKIMAIRADPDARWTTLRSLFTA